METTHIKAIFQAQNECSKKLTKVINRFFKENKLGAIKTFPLSIPTGWGKTRVSIRSILNTNNKSTVVLWPQADSHVNEIWASNYNWLRIIKKDVKEDKSFNLWTKIGEKEHSPQIDMQSLERKEIRKLENHSFFYVNGSFNKGEQTLENLFDNSRLSRNLIFVIDEWHTKDILKKFQKSRQKPKEFWTDYLFDKSKLSDKVRTFVLLVSATPIASTSHMDSVKDDFDDKHYEKSIKDSMKELSDLVCFDKDTAKIQEIYNAPISEAVNKLSSEKKKLKDFVFGRKWNWAKEYVGIYKKTKAKDLSPHLVYLNDQALFWRQSWTWKKWDDEKTKLSEVKDYDNVSNKQKALIEFLKKYKEDKGGGRRKFVIFCHHIGIAKALEAFLNNEKSLKVFVGTKKQNCAYYLSGEPKKKDEKFQSFIEDDDKLKENPERICYLIVTDKHSQGVSFHKSMAWLIHYELSWNPIRIIQRFGRVWRIKKTGNAKDQSLMLTRPVAFYIPYTYSSEEEQIHRLIRRWEILKRIQENSSININLLPVSYEIALGCRITPEP